MLCGAYVRKHALKCCGVCFTHFFPLSTLQLCHKWKATIDFVEVAEN